jgi:preprotein translocase subunit SecG
MTGNLVQDWPVYVLLGVVAFFFIFIFVKGNLQSRGNKQEQHKEQDKSQQKN